MAKNAKNKKDLYPSAYMLAWVKVLRSISRPISGPGGRIDGHGSAISPTGSYSPLQ